MKLRLKQDYVLSNLQVQEVFYVVEVYGGQEIELAEFYTYQEAEEGFEEIVNFYKNKPKKRTISEVSI